MLARAVFGNKGVESDYAPRYESRRWEVTERVDTPISHYVGGQYSHTTTDTRYETRSENRPTYVGVDQIRHDTIDIVFEYPENPRMRMRSPYWARKGQLVYVMSHRGIGRPVYDLYCPEADEWADLQTDHYGPVRLTVPILVGAIALVLQVSLRPDADMLKYAGGLAVLAYAILHARRMLHRLQLRSSRIRGNRQMIDIIKKDHADRDEIRRRIEERIR